MIGSLQPETAMMVRNRLEKPERSLNRGRSRSDLLISDKGAKHNISRFKQSRRTEKEEDRY
ncbi:unnamed protein product [Brassica oleracea var. botrytis]